MPRRIREPLTVVRAGGERRRGDHIAHRAPDAGPRALNGHKSTVGFYHQIGIESFWEF